MTAADARKIAEPKNEKNIKDNLTSALIRIRMSAENGEFSCVFNLRDENIVKIRELGYKVDRNELSSDTIEW